MYRKQQIRNWLILGLIGICLNANAKTDNGISGEKNFPLLLTQQTDAPQLKHLADSIFDVIGLENYGLGRDAFFSACKGYQYLLYKGALRKKHLLTICDYSQSANNKRLYVIDLSANVVVFNTYVSHGRNSGSEFATSFSNVENSNKSSLGFMVTDEPYYGVAGYSMRFNGMETGINDHVKNRYIVFHGSKFVNENVMRERGTIGRSLGCPAVPYGEQKQIIEMIKGGSCFYIYNPAPWYTHTSRILNANFNYESFMASGSKQNESLAGNSTDAVSAPDTDFK
jgi:hypothetical protein